MSMFFTTEACLLQVVTMCIQWRSASSKTAEDESCWFRPPKSVQEEDSLFVQSSFKSTQYKDKWTVEVFRTWRAACEQKFCIQLLDPGSVFKDYYLHRVRSLEEKLEASLSLNYWLTKIVQQIANKNEIVNSLRGMFTELKKKGLAVKLINYDD